MVTQSFVILGIDLVLCLSIVTVYEGSARLSTCSIDRIIRDGSSDIQALL